MAELTVDQKRAVIKYLLGDVSKGLFEDCDEFCTEEVENDLDGYKDAVNNFVDDLKFELSRFLDEMKNNDNYN